MRRKLVIIAAIFIVVVLLLSHIGWDALSELVSNQDRLAETNLGLFLLINFNIILVMVLGFLVVRNVVKLVLDRRNKILGSGLRARLVLAFVGLSLIPTILLFVVSRGIVGSVLEGWFSPQITSAMEDALAVARYHYKSIEADSIRRGKFLGKQLVEIVALDARAQPLQELFTTSPLGERARDYLQEKIEEYGLANVQFVTPSGQTLYSTGTEAMDDWTISPEALVAASAGSAGVRPERHGSRDLLRVYVPLRGLPLAGGPPDEAVFPVMIISSYLNQDLSRVVESYDQYRELYSYRIPLASTYFLTLVIATLMVVFAAIWVGFYLARTLSEPIQLLAEGTQEIIKGNLDVQIPAVGTDEISTLVKSFNSMTVDLKQTTGELEARRRYMETLLNSIGVGVISVDSERRVATMNPAAREMLGIAGDVVVEHRSFSDVLPAALSERIKDMERELDILKTGAATAAVAMYVPPKTRQLQVTLTPLVGERRVGAVVLLDDLTELVNAQRLAAWQEVARRMAHEIKNPLTPIQLSAERIRRKVGDVDVVGEGTATILSQVETLRSLVNEFSRFARMPQLNPVMSDLNEVVEDSLAVFLLSHPDLIVEKSLSRGLRKVPLDREQFGRVIINLLDNAAAAVLARSANPAARPSYDIRIQTVGDEQGVALSIIDTGIGISDQDKPLLFEPYFSRKKGGTGLGLAIVYSIVRDHGGSIQVLDNKPYGALFKVELPRAGGAEQ